MKIQTRFFGEVNISENQIIDFKSGIPGFDDLRKFVLIDIEGSNTLKCLQSVENQYISLMVILPWHYFADYVINLSDNEINELGLEKETDALVYNIITIRDNRITANLVAPIIINEINNKGKQIILSDTKYNVRQEIPCL